MNLLDAKEVVRNELRSSTNWKVEKQLDDRREREICRASGPHRHNRSKTVHVLMIQSNRICAEIPYMLCDIKRMYNSGRMASDFERC